MINQRFNAQEMLFTEKLDRVADVLHVRLNSKDERIEVGEAVTG